MIEAVPPTPPVPAPVRHLVLCGLMASGKTTVGNIVASALDRPLLDNDEVLEAHSAMSTARYARTYGSLRLHRRELAVLDYLVRCPVSAVITAAASVAEHPHRLRRLVAGHHVVFLEAPAQLLADRARADHRSRRPLLDADRAIEALQSQGRRRRGVYRAIADDSIEIAGLDPATVADRVLATLS